MPRFQRARALLDPRGQTKASVAAALEHILRRGGCPQCGRLSVLAIDFGDPIKEKVQGLVQLQFETKAGR